MPRKYQRRQTTKIKSNLPTHILKIGATNIGDGKSAWSRVGVGWVNDDGHISLRLNAGTVLDWHDFNRIYDKDGCVLMLFPNDE